MDRKGWIILTICGILLALNWHFKPELPKQDTPPKKSNKEKSTWNTDGSDASQPGILVATPLSQSKLASEPAFENTATLTSTDKDGKKIVKYTFTSKGGGLKTAELLNQFAVDSKKERVLLNKNASAPVGAFYEDPDEYTVIDYVLEEINGAILCRGKTPGGLHIAKRWFLEPDKNKPGAPWILKLDVTFRNKGNSTVKLGRYSFFTGTASPLHPREWENQGGAFFLDDGSLTSKDSNWFKKGFFRDARPLFQKSVENLEYAGVSNQFFTTLVRPSEKYASSLWAKAVKVDMPGGDPDKPKYAVRAGFTLPPRKLTPDEKTTLSYFIYIGPKHYSVLKKIGGNTDDVMNYGWFAPVSVVLNNVLNWLHDTIFSKLADKWAWGFSIIALTIIIRICIWPLHNKSTRTMKRMSKLQPIMKDLREKYKDNPGKLNQETMKLYKNYQINPMGGCLPMVLQIPIFFGYYRMLQYAVELRGQSFLWVDDLSMPDTFHIFHLPFDFPMLGNQLPVNILPILMAVTMVLQMRMTPNTGDKMQQRIMMFMPLMFFFFCYNFASALALYWTTQNIFSIGQTWLTNRLPEPELKKRAKPGKPGKKTFMDRMTERAEEMQRQKQAGTGKGPIRNVTPDKKKPGKKHNPKTGG